MAKKQSKSRKLDPSKRKPKPPPPNPQNTVKYAHLYQTNYATRTLSEAWERRNTEESQRVDLNRALHVLHDGDHDAAAADVAARTKRNENTTIDTVQLRTLKRIVREKLAE